jgi:hypothetical protein
MRVWLVTSQLDTGKSLTFITVYKTQPKTLHSDRTASPLFTQLHSGEGFFFYIGCASTEYRSQRARVTTLISILLSSYVS